MRKITFLLLLSSALALAGCSPGIADDPVASEWRRVLEIKKEWRSAAPADRVRAQQEYVDALAAFVRRHPDHERARQVYEEAELDFARQLTGRGDYDRAIEYYRSVLATNPAQQDARVELEAAERRRFISPEALGALRAGMSPDEVRERLGSPLPGWSRSMRRGESVIDSWYYRRRDGGVAGVFFQDGRLFAAEFDQPIRLPS